MEINVFISVTVFLLTIIIIFWRPKGINEAWPATIGALILFLTGAVSYNDVLSIFEKIGGASITIIATLVMAVILESFGFFHWAAARLGDLARGSGYRLYWYIQLLCFFMTLLFNNDGSILITTPILILLLKNLRLKPHQQIPYLLTGALMATAASTPIGVSNIVNLISLKIVHMPLHVHTAMIFVPAMLGLVCLSTIMYYLVRKKLLINLPNLSYDMEHSFFTRNFHPLKGKITVETKKQRTKFMLKILLFVLIIRCSLFIASFFALPIEFIAVLGSLILLIWRWYHLRTNPVDILKKTPWHIFLFALSMYVIVYSLHNAGLTEMLVHLSQPIVDRGLFQSTFLMGGVVSVMSNLFNNHPALLIGTLTLSEMNLDVITLRTMYLASIIGSDIGSLLLPIGTLASLIWMHILRQNKIKVKWKDYLQVSLIAIPATMLITLFILYVWISLLFS